MRHVAPTVALAVLAMTAWSPALAADSDGANVRVASFQTPSGDAYFAASVQPSATDTLLKAVRDSAADVVVVVDTSASQVGEFRRESLAALRTVIAQLRDNDRVQIFAADVRATDLSQTFDTAGGESTLQAIQKVQRRLPLGNTNLVTVIDSLRAALVAQPQKPHAFDRVHRRRCHDRRNR